VSEEKLPEPVTLDWVGVRILRINAELRDLQQRFTGIEARLTGIEVRIGALEARFGTLEARYAVQEGRLTAMLDLLVRMAERVGTGAPPDP
jgi:septal ring factor EnvC (AmiA/AmiB activator)